MGVRLPWSPTCAKVVGTVWGVGSGTPRSPLVCGGDSPEEPSPLALLPPGIANGHLALLMVLLLGLAAGGCRVFLICRLCLQPTLPFV